MATNPMEQFNVNRIGPEIKFGSLDLSFTNASLFMLISATVIYIFLFFGTRERKIIPSKVQLIAELFYNFVAKMISDTAGSKAKPPNTLSIVCPAIIFANNLTERLTGLLK
jgi:F-type H+-transporting ATPase subunit a